MAPPEKKKPLLGRSFRLNGGGVARHRKDPARPHDVFLRDHATSVLQIMVNTQRSSTSGGDLKPLPRSYASARTPEMSMTAFARATALSSRSGITWERDRAEHAHLLILRGTH